MPTTITTQRGITAKVIAAIKHWQTPPWRRPVSDLVNDGFPTRPTTFRPFTGAEVLLLNLAATEKGFKSKFWAAQDEWAYLDG
jgi:antirestriction protein ArdC